MVAVYKVPIPTEAIAQFCRRWQVSELSLFGSVLRDDFRADSDVDILVDFHADTHRTLFELVDMEDELERILGRDVDLVETGAVTSSDNYLRRREILNSAQVIYDKR